MWKNDLIRVGRVENPELPVRNRSSSRQAGAIRRAGRGDVIYLQRPIHSTSLFDGGAPREEVSKEKRYRTEKSGLGLANHC